MNGTLTWPILFGALPSLAAMLKLLLPTGERGLGRRIQRLAVLRESIPAETGRDALDATLTHLVRELAHREEMRARRKIDGSNLATIIFVAVVGGGLAWLCWQGPLPVRILGGIIAGFAAILILGGGLTQLFQVRDKFQYERDPESA